MSLASAAGNSIPKLTSHKSRSWKNMVPNKDMVPNRREGLTISGKERRRLMLLVQKSDLGQRFGDKFEFLKIVKGEIRPSRGQIETLVANLDHA
jgi:hypothetical protein